MLYPNASVVKASGDSKVYYVEQSWQGSQIHHTKRHIINEGALFGLGKTWADVITMTTTERDAMTTGAIIMEPLPTTRCLIRNSATGEISYFDLTKRFRFTSPASLNAWRGQLGISWTSDKELSPERYNAIIQGSAMYYPDSGTMRKLIRADGDTKVYYCNSGWANGNPYTLLEKIASPEALACRYAGWPILAVPPTDIATLGTLADLYCPLPSAPALITANGQVAFLHPPYKLPFTTPESLSAWCTTLGLCWDDIVAVSSADYNSIPTGNWMYYPYNTLIRGPDGKVFWINQTWNGGNIQHTKHYVPNQQTLACRFNGWTITNVPQADVNAIPQGSNITCP